jgi:[acyl-carrier-protein] S-malonyltransferase
MLNFRGICTKATVVSNRVCFLFPGQGVQYLGMSKELCKHYPEARNLFNNASEILGYDLLHKCIHGTKSEIDSTEVAQSAIFVSSMAALEKLKHENISAYNNCTITMGLSLGEYSALCYAGAFSFEDGVKLTKARGKAMQSASDTIESGMVSIIGLDIDGVNNLCKAVMDITGQPISIANFLMDKNYTVAGSIESCKTVKEIAKSMGARMAFPLSVSGAFHTEYMRPAVAPLREALEKVKIITPRIPVISNVDGKIHTTPDSIREKLALQVTTPVQWEQSLTSMILAHDYEMSYEIGPGTVINGLITKGFGKSTSIINVKA